MSPQVLSQDAKFHTILIRTLPAQSSAFPLLCLMSNNQAVIEAFIRLLAKGFR